MRAVRQSGRVALANGTIRTLINIYQKELMGMHGTCQREIASQMYGDGSGNDDKDLDGLGIICDSQVGYGGKETDAFGYHNWQQTLEGAQNPQENGCPARHAPFDKDFNQGNVSVYGDLEAVLIDINRRGGNHAIAQENVPEMEIWVFLPQRDYSRITHVLRNVLRRPTERGGQGASAEIGGFVEGMYWEEYNAWFYPDTRCPAEHMYGFNRHCLKYAQMDDDQQYIQMIRVADSQDAILIPVHKDHNFKCDDRSQCFRFYNYSGIAS
jgi:hypothetical protein